MDRIEKILRDYKKPIEIELIGGYVTTYYLNSDDLPCIKENFLGNCKTMRQYINNYWYGSEANDIYKMVNEKLLKKLRDIEKYVLKKIYVGDYIKQ